MAIQMVKKTSFQNNTSQFISEIQKSSIFANTQILNYQKEFSNKRSTLTLSLIGEELDKTEIAVLQEKMNDFGIKNTDLVIKQTESIVNANMQTDVLEKIIDQKNQQIVIKDSTIVKLKNSLLMVNADSTLSRQIAKEISAQYPFISSFSINNSIYTDPHTLTNDTLPTALLTWSSRPNATTMKQLETWIRIRLDLDTLKIIVNQ
jgi:hypothetical protein